jgi:hypothetical protein
MSAQTLEQQEETSEQPEDAKATRLGRALDVAGVVAGVVLGVILIDIVSGGKLTRWAQSRRSGKPAGGPCEGCDEAPAPAPAPGPVTDNDD